MDTTGSDNEPATENTSFWDSIQQSPYFQIEAGFYSGFILGMVPFGGVIEEGCEAVEPSTREARFGRGVGLMLAGIYTAFTGANGEVLGGITTATGVGAAIGVPAMAVSTTLVIGGFTNAGIGFRETLNALMSSEDSGAGTGSGAGPPAAKGGLHRPYVRKGTRADIEAAAPRDSTGRPIDPNTRKPIDGKPDIGHKPGNEFRREKVAGEAEGLTQRQFNDRMNDPSKYQLEDLPQIAATSTSRSHDDQKANESSDPHY